MRFFYALKSAKKTVTFVGMDIQAEKLGLIQWLAQLSDENVIAKIKSLKNETAQEVVLESGLVAESDAAFNLAYQKAEEDKAAGRVKPHADIRKKYDKWL